MTCLDTNVTSSTFVLDVSRAAFDVLMLSSVILINVAILFVVVRRWITEGMPIANVTSSLLVINLSFADLVVGICSVFYFLPRYSCDLMDVLSGSKNCCILRFALVIMGHLGSGYTLAAIAADRYLAVCWAVRYRHIMSPKHTVGVIVIIWVFAVSGSMVLFGWNNWNGKECTEDSTLPLWYILSGGVLGQFIILGAVSTAHWKIHRKVLEMRNRTSRALKDGVSSAEDQMGTRATRVLALILGVYVTSWAPFMAVLVIDKAWSPVSDVIFETASSLVNLNYLVNPFIYAYNNRTIQKAILSSLNSFKRKAITPWNEQSNSVTVSRHEVMNSRTAIK